MAFWDEALFEPGHSYTDRFDTAIAASTDGADWLGMEKVWRDIDWANAPKYRSNRFVRRRVVRNTSGGALLPQRLGQLDATTRMTSVPGYTILDGGRGFPIDEFLPSGGVLANDLFYVVLEGPAMVLTGLNGDGTNVINQGDDLTGLTTASSSQGTSSGRVKTAVWTGATSVLAVELAHIIGVALTAATTANTGVNLLVDVRQF